jgi:phosphoglycolate phosphatase-like HAD superfamily hydrolase
MSACGNANDFVRGARGKLLKMMIIIELEGPIIDLGPVHYQAYLEVATELGWSRMDQPTYWRLMRTRGREAAVLPGAPPVKLKAFWTRFDQLVEQSDVIGRYQLLPGIEGACKALTRHGRCCLVTLGSNIEARRQLVKQLHLADAPVQLERLDADPRRRPGELRVAGGSERRVIVAAGSDALVRAANQAELTTVGLSSGSCTATRLHRAGVDIVYGGLEDLVDSLQAGAKDLIQAGLLPPSLG